MNNYMKILIFLLVVSYFLATACGDDEDADADAGSDTDTDTDTDADTDTDVDTDTDTDADTDADSDTDTDTDTGGIVPGENPFEMDCDADAGVLFDWGVKKVTTYAGAGMEESDLSIIFTYTYESEVLASSTVEHYEGGEVTSSYERSHSYSENGQLESIEWEEEANGNATHWRRNYAYDGSGRLLSETWQYEDNDDGITDTYSINSFAYDEDGIVVQQRYEYFYDGYTYRWGYDYEYDEKGRLSRAIQLDPEDNWVETDNYLDYIYDGLGRISQVVDADGVAEIYSYVGDTPQIVTIETSDDSYMYAFEWDGYTVTKTYWNFGEIAYRDVYVFSEEGDSYFWKLLPTPAVCSTVHTYGIGYINDCIDLEG